jgi:hypothetical protein
LPRTTSGKYRSIGGRVEVDLVFGDELEHHGGDEHLGHAADPEPAVGRHRRAGGEIRYAAGQHSSAARVTDYG